MRMENTLDSRVRGNDDQEQPPVFIFVSDRKLTNHFVNEFWCADTGSANRMRFDE